ncbi:MAG TPA: glycoside hydrolase family 15 protein [Myxococcales bacterium]|nr:glycoside hydrolase family 15 protein [Myxococcales bacterium]
MPSRIEDYAIIADCRSAALVAKDGSIDWLCLPRFDSDACFAALLGSREHGRWQIAPAGGVRRVHRRYREGTLVLETEFETDEGSVTLVDLMPMSGQGTDLARIVVGNRGRVPMRMELIIRFGYGAIVPWVRAMEGGIEAVGGPEVLRLVTPVATHGEGLTTVALFSVGEGERIPFVLTWAPSHLPDPGHVDAEQALAGTEAGWREWSAQCQVQGPYRPIVLRSLITLKALTYDPTGGIAAAATTSIPEELGGVRNWDYRICWLRDATFTLYSLMSAGYSTEARAWRDWLLRAVAGDPAQIQIMYGLAGERRLPELTLDWLPGYEGSRPVRIGNAASNQLQLDVYGEVMGALHVSRRVGLPYEQASWALQRNLMEYLETIWNEPDEGIWEVRGPRRHFTHSKVMAWLAMDRAVKSIEQFGTEGPLDRWRALRDQIHESVCRHGYDAELGSFVQSYGSKEVDASLLMLPVVGFLPPEDPRVRGTVAAAEKRLLRGGFLDRYETRSGVDGLPPGEGAFLPCSFWLADNYVLQGRREEARALFERLVGLANDVGLLSEEYDRGLRRLVGNFPQALSHVSLINTAVSLSRPEGPAQDRQNR